MTDLKQQPGENRSQYGWRLLMHDLRNPKGNLEPQPEQEVSTSKDGSIVNNIYNYPQGTPMSSTKFNFASIYATIATVIILTIAGLLLWRCGFIDYLLGWL